VMRTASATRHLRVSAPPPEVRLAA
jgi:hypothetical protein